MVNTQKLYYKYKYEETANKKIWKEENPLIKVLISQKITRLENRASSGDVESDFVPSWFSEE